MVVTAHRCAKSVCLSENGQAVTMEGDEGQKEWAEDDGGKERETETE